MTCLFRTFVSYLCLSILYMIPGNQQCHSVFLASSFNSFHSSHLTFSKTRSMILHVYCWTPLFPVDNLLFGNPRLFNPKRFKAIAKNEWERLLWSVVRMRLNVSFIDLDVVFFVVAVVFFILFRRKSTNDTTSNYRLNSKIVKREKIVKCSNKNVIIS